MRIAVAPDSRPSTAAGPSTGKAAEDRALLARVVAGDALALEEVFARYGRPCWSLARRVLVDEQLAHDVVQEVFLVVWRDAAKFDPDRGSFASWLMSMTHHKAVDAVRREEAVRKRRTTDELLEERPDEGDSPADIAWQGMRRDRVRAALGELPEAQREALALAYFGGYTQREIAQLTSTPLGTVKTRMLAGMRRLRDSLEPLAGGAS